MKNKYSLTFPQKNIWAVEEFFGKSAINTISGIFYVNFDFKREICEKAINKMVELNDALRIQLYREDSSVYQKVINYEYFKVDFFDLTTGDRSEDELNYELTKVPFDVISAPLYYFAIVKVADTKGYILVKLHHLISDAWTYANVATELSLYIDGFEEGRDEFCANPTYNDFIISEQEYIKSDKFEKDGKFWQEYLAGFTEPVGLKNTGEILVTTAKRYTVRLEEGLNLDIKNYCKVNRISPYILFMSALAIYIHRVTGKNDLIIGTPVLNRSNFKEKKMMGMFVSTMPVRFKIDESLSFDEVCKNASKESFTLFRHQKYPYSLMLQEFRAKNGANNNLYSVMLSYQNARAEYENIEKYTTDWFFSAEAQDEFSIHIMDMDETGVLQVHFDYLVNCFSDVEIKYIASRIFVIIQDGIKNNSSVENIEIMTKSEKDKILYEFNNTKSVYPRDKTVIELFEEQVEFTPEKLALEFEGRQVTYLELREKANFVASYLSKIGCKPYDRIGLMQGKGIDIIVSMLAILKLGAIYVPMNPNASAVTKRHIIQNSKIKFVISDTKRASISGANIISFYDIPFEKAEAINYKGKPGDVINIMYTSGTTGTPKGVQITNRNIVKLVKNSNYIEFGQVENMLQTGTNTFDASTLEIWNALLNGLSLYIVKGELLNPALFEEYIKEKKIDIFFLTTAIFNQMVQYNPSMFSEVKLVMTGGEAMSKEHAKRLIKGCPNTILENLYGPTENAVVTTYYKVGLKDEKIPIGKPLSNTTCFVLDSKKRLCPIGVEGLLYVGGDGVAKGYINDELKTSEKFGKIQYTDDIVYNTGDVVSLRADGNILFIGRMDDEIKIKGIRVNLDDVRRQVCKYSGITDAIVLNFVDESKNNYLGVAFTSNSTEDISKLKKYLRQYLSPQIIPRKIIQVDKFPLNQNDKIDKMALKEQFDKLNTEKTNKANYTGIYEKLYELFKEVLEITDIDIDDDFFEIGGDSLLGVTVMTKALKRNINITYSDLYKYRSIKELGDFLEGKFGGTLISSNISHFDYTRIDRLLKSQDTNILAKNLQGDMILAGATGFLGLHILMDFLENTDKKVYCLVRKANSNDARARLFTRLEYYFSAESIKKYENRIQVIEYDGELTNNVLNKIDMDGITHLVNALALVKHYGNDEEFHYVNVDIVDRLSDFCIKKNIELVHISTLSVSGDIVETAREIDSRHVKKKNFTECDLYIGQKLDNIYAYTKFLAERIVLEKIIDKGLRAKILRMGNLSDRYLDGKFQINGRDNAFSERLKSLILLGLIPEDTCGHSVDFTPVDYAARAVVKALGINCRQIIYHLYNTNKVPIKTLVDELGKMKIELKFATEDEISSKIQKVLASGQHQRINGIITDITKEKNLKYVTDIEVTNNITEKILMANGFVWPAVDDGYIIRTLKRIINS